MLVATSSAALSVFYLIFILFFLPVSLGSMSCGTLAGTIYTIYIYYYTSTMFGSAVRLDKHGFCFFL